MCSPGAGSRAYGRDPDERIATDAVTGRLYWSPRDTVQLVARGPTLGAVLAARSKVRAIDVLVVDDDPQLREFFVTSLTLEGYHVAAAANGADALAYLRCRGPVAVILLDLSMPVMDGWTFCREQQRDHRLADIPVIVTSASLNDRLTRQRHITAAFEKPIDFRDVLQVIRTYCPAHASRAASSSPRGPRALRRTRH